MTYFNEIDSFCAQWIRNSFAGEVDERSIVDISKPTSGTRQHYFAGLGGWEYALRLAGWPDYREVWTGSCPCQPFSVAGKGKGEDEERHLWPAFHKLIAIGRPTTIFGEQVAGKDGRVWLAGVRADLEKLGYAVGAADLCAAGIGAPHIRQRLYWVAHTERARWSPRSTGSEINTGRQPEQGRGAAWTASTSIYCSDGKWRRIPLEPGLLPLADDGRFGNPRVNTRMSSRIGALKAAGNAICVPLAAEFIRAVLEL